MPLKLLPLIGSLKPRVSKRGEKVFAKSSNYMNVKIKNLDFSRHFGYNDQMKKLITSALPYVNNVPHLGNLIQVLSADVFARFCRLRKYETLYICGTDEYGTATETKAQQEGVTPRELCDRFHALHAKNYKWFNIAFDYFGRTSDAIHTKITQDIYLKLDENNFIVEEESQQLYCESCARFLADRFVSGTCPHCGYEDARGDQCEHCGKLLEPTELVKPVCSVCGNTPHPKTTKHLYIDLPAILPLYETWLEKASKEGEWANNALQMTKSWIRDGLHKRAITRDLKWGIPVPQKGYENKVFYVWFDAPIGYISITKKCAELNGFDWKNWWLDADDVQLFQFIGKDNIPFHTVIFPSTLLGTKQNWTKLFHMSSTEYLNYENGKFSKSKGIGVFGTDAEESGIPADIWRFYIFYNRPEKSDTSFTWKDFQEKVNSELIGNLCNLVNRSLSFITRYFGGETLPVDESTLSKLKNKKVSDAIKSLRNALEKTSKKITEVLDWAELKEAFQSIFALSTVANKTFQELEPWKLVKEAPFETQVFLSELCYFIKDLMIMVHPYLPQYADEVASFLDVKIWSGNIFDEVKPVSKPVKDALAWEDIGKRIGLKKIKEQRIIFKTFEEKQIKEFKEKYSGMQKDNAKTAETNSANKKNATNATNETQTKLSPTEIFNQNIKLKVAKIIAIEKHPDADKLYVEKLDDGSGEERTIVSGLVPFYEAEELLGKHVIIADNLKGRKMRGVMSKGMLLAASMETEAGEVVEVLTAPDCPPGTEVILEGATPKEKPDEISADTFFSVEMVVKDFVFQLDGKNFTASGKAIKSEKVKNGSVG